MTGSNTIMYLIFQDLQNDKQPVSASGDCAPSRCPLSGLVHEDLILSPTEGPVLKLSPGEICVAMGYACGGMAVSRTPEEPAVLFSQLNKHILASVQGGARVCLEMLLRKDQPTLDPDVAVAMGFIQRAEKTGKYTCRCGQVCL